MNRYRMFKQHLSSDCTVTLIGVDGSSTYPAHRSVLAEASAMFKTKLANWSDPDSPKLEVSTPASLDVVEELLRFAYFDRLSDDFPKGKIVWLVFAADKYILPSLIEACVRRLVNVVGSLSWTRRFEILSLPDSLVSSHLCVEAFMEGHLRSLIICAFLDLDEAWQNVETRNFFLALPAKQVLKLLSSRYMKATEDSVLMAMLSWIRNRKQEDADDDRGVVRALFTMLRVQCLSRTFLLGVLRQDPAFEQFVDDGVLRDVVLYDAVVQHRHKRPRKSTTADDIDMPTVRNRAPDHVMIWRVPVEKLAAANDILEDHLDPITVTLLGPATFFAGIWWRLVLHIGEYYGDDDEDDYENVVAVGLVPLIKIDRIASVAESWSIVEHHGPAIDEDGELLMTGVLDTTPGPDVFPVRSLHTFSAGIVMDYRFRGSLLEDSKTFDCSGIQKWNVRPCLRRREDTEHGKWDTENGFGKSLSIKVTMKIDSTA